MPYKLKSRALASRRAARPWVIQHGVPFLATNPTVSLFAINPVSTLRSKSPKKSVQPDGFVLPFHSHNLGLNLSVKWAF